jgi:hypothetical protein
MYFYIFVSNITLDTDRSFVLSRPHISAVVRFQPVEKSCCNKCIIVVIKSQCLKKPKPNIATCVFHIKFNTDWLSVRNVAKPSGNLYDRQENYVRNVTSGVKRTLCDTGGQSPREHLNCYCWCQKHQAGLLYVKSLGKMFACYQKNVINSSGETIFQVNYVFLIKYGVFRLLTLWPVGEVYFFLWG